MNLWSSRSQHPGWPLPVGPLRVAAGLVRLRPIRGSGIGLALVEHIAKAHGGRVAVASQVGAGAIFTISIPAAQPA